MNVTLYEEIVVRIIREQELVIGPLAWVEAAKVQGLQVIDQRAGTILFTDASQGAVVDRLIAQYERLFGRASHQVSKDAVKGLIANMLPAEIPESLR